MSNASSGLIMLTKFVEWFKVHSSQSRVDANKVTTEFRLQCAQREYMCKTYSNPMNIIKLRTANEQKGSQRLFLNARIVTEYRVDKILFQHRRSKNSLFHKHNNKIEPIDKQSKNQNPILSPAFEDSDHCLKTLVGKIQSMIKAEYELISNHNVLEELQNDIKQSQCSLIFGNEEQKISEIICTKQNSQQTTFARNRKDQRQIPIEIQQIQKTQPILAEKGIVDEYGIMRHPPPVAYFKRKKQGSKTKGNQSSNSSWRSKSMSKGSISSKKDVTPKKKQKMRKNESPYHPFPKKQQPKRLTSAKKKNTQNFHRL